MTPEIVALVLSSAAFVTSMFALVVPRIRVVRVSEAVKHDIVPDKVVAKKSDPSWRQFYRAKMRQDGLIR